MNNLNNDRLFDAIPQAQEHQREDGVPPTFQSHGHTWTKHAPGDPPPVPKATEVYVILEGGRLIDEPIVARNLNWGECEHKHLYNIKGYRLATPLAEEPSELAGGNQEGYTASKPLSKAAHPHCWLTACGS
jgi:hypothetical protein